MSASLTTDAMLSAPGCGPIPPPPEAARGVLPSLAPGHEALQALLAFSALSDQIRRRRADTDQSAVEGSELEPLVLDEVLHLVAERALSITGADGVAIALADGQDIVCRASAGQIAPDPGIRLDPNFGFSGACFRNGETVRCDAAESDPRVNVQASSRLGARSLVAVPLGRRTVLGLLEAFSYQAYAFNDSDVRALELLAELMLAAMKPEEEDRLAEISRQVAARSKVEPANTTHQPQRIAVEPRVKSPAPPSAEKIEKTTHSSSKTAGRGGRPGLMVVLCVVLFATALGAGLWWKMLRATQNVRASVQPPVAISTPLQVKAIDTAPSETKPEEDLLTATIPPTDIKQQLSVLPQVTGIRHWNSSEGSTVVLDLQDQVQYEAHRLTDPVRIYVDLHDTSLAPSLNGKSIEVGDAMLIRVRLAQPMPGVTRVVLETAAGTNFAVSLEPNPYRLMVQVRPLGVPNSPHANVDLFAPMTPAEGSQLATGTATREDLQLRAKVPHFRIALDAGHGGWDLGTVGRQGLLEKDLALDIVERLGNLLQKRLGAEVVYTRQDDNYIGLEKRAEIANQAQADLFLSVHANYSVSTSARGVETYYTNTFSSIHSRSRESGEAAVENIDFANLDIREKVQESHRFAASVQRSLHGSLAASNPGIPNRGVKEASYVVLTGTFMPAILAEVSFVSSPDDEENLQSKTYRQRIAEALYKGIEKYEAAPRKMKLASNSVNQPESKTRVVQ